MSFARVSALTAIAACALAPAALADENLFGYVKGAETLPKGALEIYQWVTVRGGKSYGDYTAVDTKTEAEYGLSDRFSIAGAIKTLSIDTDGLSIDGYLPGPKHYTLKPSGVEFEGKYNFLKPALDSIGLAVQFGISYSWLDPHSGQDKNTVSAETALLLQKYFLEGRLVWVGNLGYEATWAKRAAIANLPAGFDWSTKAEMEIELRAGTGLTYRFAPNWFLGAELLYETEFETEVGQERWSIFAGPSLHYGSERWWATLTWLPQIRGGGESFPEQTKSNLHLIEKTEQEVRLKIGLNF